jgi:hypothetical protein
MTHARSEAKSDLLKGIAGAARADLDRHLAVETLEEAEQLVGSEPVEMSIHQVGYLRLLDAEQGGNLLLREFTVGEQLIDVIAQLGPGQPLVGVGQAQVGEDVAGAFLVLDPPVAVRSRLAHVSPALSLLCIAV